MKILLILILCFCVGIEASNIATQTITFSVDPIAEIDVTGDPPPFAATSIPAGSGSSSIYDTSTSYAITTNGSSQRITVCINSPMPTGTCLCLMPTPPNGASAVCVNGIDTSDQVIITGISQVAQGNLQLSYEFQCDPTAGVIPPTTRIVTFTLTP